MPTITVISPEGISGEVPAENLQAALAGGFKRATAVTSPEGVAGWVPQENAYAAINEGKYTLGHAPTPPPAKPENPAVGMLTGVLKGIGVAAQTYSRQYVGLLKGAEGAVGDAVSSQLSPESRQKKK